MIGSIERPKEAQVYFQDADTFSQNQKLIDDFNLTTDDINFIITYKFERYEVKKEN